MQKILLVFFALAIAGCAFRDKVDTPFIGDPKVPFVMPAPDNPDPDAVVETAYCRRNGAGGFDEAVPVSASGAENGIAWAQGGGCVLKPIKEVWARLSNQAAMKWDDANDFSWSLENRNFDGYTHIYDINYSVKSIITVRWNMKWFHSIYYGDYAAPRAVAINYQKVSGADQIRFWRGGITIQRVTGNVTSISVRNELRSASTLDKDIRSTLGSVLEVIHKGRTAEPDYSNFSLIQ